jgi:predicted RNA-binding protein YlxR (DUF448 family)
MRRVNERSSFLSRKKHPRSSLVRFVVIEGKITLDPTNSLRGRGAYLLKSEILEALDKHAFERTFKKSLTEQEKEEIQKGYGK